MSQLYTNSDSKHTGASRHLLKEVAGVSDCVFFGSREPVLAILGSPNRSGKIDSQDTVPWFYPGIVFSVRDHAVAFGAFFLGEVLIVRMVCAGCPVSPQIMSIRVLKQLRLSPTTPLRITGGRTAGFRWDNRWGVFARRATWRPIFCSKKNRLIYTSPHKSREECIPRGVNKVSPYCEVDESVFGLGFTQFRGFTSS